MVSMLYTCLLLLAFDVISLAERSERLDYGDLSLSDVSESLPVCKELIWDNKTIQKRQRRGMEVGKAGHILEMRLLRCLDELGFQAFPAFDPKRLKHSKMRFVNNPDECLPRGGVATLSVLQRAPDPMLKHAPEQMETVGRPSIFECRNRLSYRELRRCFHSDLPHGEKPSMFTGSDLYSPSTIFIRFE